MLRLFFGWLSIIIVWQLDMISTIKKSKNTFTLAIIIWFERPVLSYSKRQSRTEQVCSHMICIFIFLIMSVQAPFHVLYIDLINVFLFRLYRISLHTQSCWKFIKKTSFYFLVQNTRKCINFIHLSHKPIKLCVIYSNWKKINIRNQSQRSRDHIKEKVASWPLKLNRTTA